MAYRISIIIPIYNVEAYIMRCLRSVTSQTISDGIECILVDDCSSDATEQIVKEFIDSYQGNIHFLHVHHEVNKGVSEARNTAMDIAKGEYIYFLDSDDSIAADCMEEMIRLIDKYPNVDMVIGNNDINDILRVPFGEFTSNKKVILRNLLYYNGRAVAAQRHMVRRDLILQRRLSFLPGIIHEDNLWTFLLSTNIRSVAFSTKDQYHYRKDNPNSIMRSKKIDKETYAYKTIIEQTCNNIGSFMKGTQKEYIFCNLQTAVNAHYYESEEAKRQLIGHLSAVSSLMERLLLNVYFQTSNSFVKHIASSLLHRCYKLLDYLSR